MPDDKKKPLTISRDLLREPTPTLPPAWTPLKAFFSNDLPRYAGPDGWVLKWAFRGWACVKDGEPMIAVPSPLPAAAAMREPPFDRALALIEERKTLEPLGMTEPVSRVVDSVLPVLPASSKGRHAAEPELHPTAAEDLTGFEFVGMPSWVLDRLGRLRWTADGTDWAVATNGPRTRLAARKLGTSLLGWWDCTLSRWFAGIADVDANEPLDPGSCSFSTPLDGTLDVPSITQALAALKAAVKWHDEVWIPTLKKVEDEVSSVSEPASAKRRVNHAWNAADGRCLHCGTFNTDDWHGSTCDEMKARNERIANAGKQPARRRPPVQTTHPFAMARVGSAVRQGLLDDGWCITDTLDGWDHLEPPKVPRVRLTTLKARAPSAEVRKEISEEVEKMHREGGPLPVLFPRLDAWTRGPAVTAEDFRNREALCCALEVLVAQGIGYEITEFDFWYVKGIIARSRGIQHREHKDGTPCVRPDCKRAHKFTKEEIQQAASIQRAASFPSKVVEEFSKFGDDAPPSSVSEARLETRLDPAPRQWCSFPLVTRTGEHTVPWAMIAPHEFQARVNHGKGFEALAEQGGLSAAEMLAVLRNRPYEMLSESVALQLIRERVYKWRRPPLSEETEDVVEIERKLEKLLEVHNKHNRHVCVMEPRPQPIDVVGEERARWEVRADRPGVLHLSRTDPVECMRVDTVKGVVDASCGSRVATFPLCHAEPFEPGREGLIRAAVRGWLRARIRGEDVEVKW